MGLRSPSSAAHYISSIQRHFPDWLGVHIQDLVAAATLMSQKRELCISSLEMKGSTTSFRCLPSHDPKRDSSVNGHVSGNIFKEARRDSHLYQFKQLLLFSPA